jgi:hypothetical protein
MPISTRRTLHKNLGETEISAKDEWLPCLQKPRAYQGHSLTVSSGFACKNKQSGLLQLPQEKTKRQLPHQHEKRRGLPKVLKK